MHPCRIRAKDVASPKLFRLRGRGKNDISTEDAFVNLVKCIQKGCFEDPLPLDELFELLGYMPKLRFPIWRNRGQTVKNEALHRVLNRIVDGVSTASWELMHARVALVVFHFNRLRAIERRLAGTSDPYPWVALLSLYPGTESLVYDTHGQLTGWDYLRAADEEHARAQTAAFIGLQQAQRSVEPSRQPPACAVSAVGSLGRAGSAVSAAGLSTDSVSDAEESAGHGAKRPRPGSASSGHPVYRTKKFVQQPPASSRKPTSAAEIEYAAQCITAARAGATPSRTKVRICQEAVERYNAEYARQVSQGMHSNTAEAGGLGAYVTEEQMGQFVAMFDKAEAQRARLAALPDATAPRGEAQAAAATMGAASEPSMADGVVAAPALPEGAPGNAAAAKRPRDRTASRAAAKALAQAMVQEQSLSAAQVLEDTRLTNDVLEALCELHRIAIRGTNMQKRERLKACLEAKEQQQRGMGDL